MSAPDTAQPPTVRGATLEQYAGVSAALAEGIPLAEVLAQEQIAEQEWPAIERGFRELVVPSSALQIALARARRVAMDCLSRPIDPLDDDAAAWVGLLGALATNDEPDHLLGQLGITMNDVDRLGRSWKRRAQSDPELARRMTELAPEAQPPGNVRTGPLELRPFPWTPGPRAAAPEPDPLQGTDAVVRSVRAGSVPVPARASFQLADDAAAQASSVERAAPDPDETMAPFHTGPALPFRSDAHAAVPLPAPLADASGETLAIPDAREPEAGHEADAGGATLPFDPDGWLSLLKLERYAEMATQLRAEPARADAIMGAFGLDTAEKRTKLHNLWKLRFQANAPLRQSFDRLIEEKLATRPRD